MSLSLKQRAYHDSRTEAVAEKLRAALERMRTGKPRRLPPPFRWSKKSWAAEAEVNKDTVVAKNADGTFQFSRENADFEQLRAGRSPRHARLQKALMENAALQDENQRLKEALANRILGKASGDFAA